MRKDDLIDSIGMIDDDLIQSVDALRRTRKAFSWKRWAGLAACFCLILAAVSAMPGLFRETTPPPPVQNDFPVQTNPKQPEQTTHPEDLAPDWTAIYNESEAMLAMDRVYIQGIFSEELNESQLTAVMPEKWSDGMDCSGNGVFDNQGNLLDVIVTVNTSEPVTVTMTNTSFGTCFLLDGEAEISICGDVEYRLYEYAYEQEVHLGAEAAIGGTYLHFTMDTTPQEVEQAKLEFQKVLECFASYPDGRPDLSVIIPEEIPELMEQMFGTLSEARTEPDFGGYLPTELPDGFAESSIRRFRFDDSNYLSALWSRGLNDLSWVVTHYTEADAHRLTGINELENYDLSLYPIPRADSVPEELREIVDDPIFDAEELTLEAVYRRAYKVQDAGDTDGWRMRFSVRYGDVLISISSKGVEPEWLFDQLIRLRSNNG